MSSRVTPSEIEQAREAFRHVMDNRVVRMAPSYSVDGLRWTKSSRSWAG